MDPQGIMAAAAATATATQGTQQAGFAAHRTPGVHAHGDAPAKPRRRSGRRSLAAVMKHRYTFVRRGEDESRLHIPSSCMLDAKAINCVGNLSKVGAQLERLDLSANKLADWGEVCTTPCVFSCTAMH